MERDRIELTAEQAIALLPDGDYVHTVRNPTGVMLGADWKRAEIVEAITNTDFRSLSGVIATRTGHGLCIKNAGSFLLIATKRERLESFEATVGVAPV